MVVSQSAITCYLCNAYIPYDKQKNAFICPQCGKVWIINICKPTHEETTYIPGAKHAMGSKNNKSKGNKEMMKKPSLNMMFNRLFNQN